MIAMILVDRMVRKIMMNDGGDSDDHDKTIVMLEMMVIMIMISKRFPKIILLLKVLSILKTPTSCATL